MFLQSFLGHNIFIFGNFVHLFNFENLSTLGEWTNDCQFQGKIDTGMEGKIINFLSILDVFGGFVEC